MKRPIRLAAAVLAAMTLTIPPASADTSRVGFETTGVTSGGPIFDPDQVSQRCPDGWVERMGVILVVQGTGELTTELSDEPMTVQFEDTHCSVPRPPAETWFPLLGGDRNYATPIQMESGIMQFTTTDGLSTLTVHYRGPGVMKGDIFLLEPGDTNTHTFNGPYEIVDGTGIFEGASGHGRISGTAVATHDGTLFGAIDFEWTMDGTLRLP
ncbi:MAG TPA: hypothetical protein VFZ63_02640 [Jiangellaceae bacterium]